MSPLGRSRIELVLSPDPVTFSDAKSGVDLLAVPLSGFWLQRPEILLIRLGREVVVSPVTGTDSSSGSFAAAGGMKAVCLTGAFGNSRSSALSATNGLVMMSALSSLVVSDCEMAVPGVSDVSISPSIVSDACVMASGSVSETVSLGVSSLLVAVIALVPSMSVSREASPEGSLAAATASVMSIWRFSSASSGSVSPTGSGVPAEMVCGVMMVEVRGGTVAVAFRNACTGRAITPVWVSIPVATTDTRIMPSSFSSKADPKMITASGSTSLRIRLAASSTSNRVMSIPPVTLMSTACAPFIVVSSSKGLLIAASAASMARLSPEDSPVPIIALPISPITARMSAKSRLIMPGLIIRSVTPQTPWCRTVSAI